MPLSNEVEGWETAYNQERQRWGVNVLSTALVWNPRRFLKKAAMCFLMVRPGRSERQWGVHNRDQKVQEARARPALTAAAESKLTPSKIDTERPIPSPNSESASS